MQRRVLAVIPLLLSLPRLARASFINYTKKALSKDEVAKTLLPGERQVFEATPAK